MFNWRVEEMKLMEKGGVYQGDEKIYRPENTLTKDEKISFVDKNNDGNLSYLIDLSNKFNNDKNNLPKDQCGNVKTVSLKAWIKRNDTKKLLDNSFHIGKAYIYSLQVYLQDNFKPIRSTKYNTYNDLIDEVFHRCLKDCEKKEIQYFKAHDQYQISLTKLRKNSDKYRTNFGTKLSFCSDGTVSVYRNDNLDDMREITLEEANKLNKMYERLESFIKELTEENDIEY